MSDMSVAVVGNLSLDLVDDGPPRVGGPPYYAAQALAALGAPALVRVKTSEADRPRVLPPLEALGLSVEWRPGDATATYAFSYDGDLRSMDVLELGSRWSAEDVAGVDADWVHVGALFHGEFPADTLMALTSGGARLSFDGQGLVRPARSGPLELEPDADLSLLGQVTALKLSEEEALALTGGVDEQSLSELGVPEVVVTLGSHGSMLVAERRLVRIPADPLDVEPTGAGDAFAAAYVHGRSLGMDPRPAAESATRLVHDLLASRR